MSMKSIWVDSWQVLPALNTGRSSVASPANGVNKPARKIAAELLEFPRPLDYQFLLISRQAGVSVHENIVPWRHLAGLQLGYDLPQFTGFFSIVILVPYGKVELTTSVLHIMGDQPRNGSDSGVPGPHGLVRVAIIASAPDYGFHFRGHRNIALYGGVQAFYRQKLDSHKTYQQTNPYSQKPLSHQKFYVNSSMM
jgi:hypothetical protein